ncbi:hypothetical protein Lal_00012597 [Lupinus albus]|nr:hypothetical protein Lal_00012597 [Lupinus albus]
MNNEEDCNSEQSMLTHRSHSKKLGGFNFGKKHESPRKRVKMRDLDSITQSSESNTNSSEFTKDEEHIIQQMSQMTKLSVTVDMDASNKAKSGRKTFKAEVNLAPTPLDLNTEACSATYSSLDKSAGCETLTKVSLSEKRKREQHSNFSKSKGINVDLNADDVNSSVNLQSAHYQKGHGQFKSRDVSKSASCSGRRAEEKDPMRIWKEMKQNGFLSSSHGGIPVPKPRERKIKNDMLKKNLELAKQEQVNKFTKIAAPSGLLNELNPGIINHVRNRKQVHSIIEALVKSEKNESRSTRRNQASHRMSRSTEVSQRDPRHTTDVGKHQLTFPHEEGNLHSSSGKMETKQYPVSVNDSSSWTLNDKVSDCKTETCTIEKASLESGASHSTRVTEDGISALNLSSSTNASMSSANLLKEEPSNFTIVSSLSLKGYCYCSFSMVGAATSGYQRANFGRRRVRSVMTTELPLLMSKEYENNMETDLHAMKISDTLLPRKTTDLHRARWNALFNRMDEELSEEEKQLGSWLNQVKEKQLLCDQGLHHVNWSMAYGLQQLGTENDSRSSTTIDRLEKELTVNAAAASIYSTCNFLMSES